MASDPTLNQLLAAQGLTTKPAGNAFAVGAKHIYRDGVVVFTGDAYEVMAWLKDPAPRSYVRTPFLLCFTIHGRPQRWTRYAVDMEQALREAAVAVDREWPDAGAVEMACMPCA